MVFKRKAVILAALVFALASCAAFAAEHASLFGDTIHYNSNTKRVQATGNVVLSRGQSRVYGDSGEGTIDNGVFEFKGGITGNFPEYNAELKSAESLKWRDSVDGNGQLEASGGVHLTRGVRDYIRANYVLWVVGTDSYTARGNVDMRYEERILRASEAKCTSTSFTGKDVTRYEDKLQKTIMSAKLIEGKTKDGVVQEVVATGHVVIGYTDREGFKTKLTGAKAIYSRELDTIVITGGAKAVRSDGKTVSADKMTMRVGPKNIEAAGSAKITFTIEKKEDEKKNEKKSGVAN